MTMSEAVARPLVPANIAGLAPYEPGKPIEEVERELGISGVVKLASNENPLGPSALAVAAAAAVIGKVSLYPDGGSHYLKAGLAGRLGVTPRELVVGSGSSEIIEGLVRTFCTPADEVLTFAYSFVMYPIVCQAQGVPMVEAPLGERFGYDVDALLERVTPRTKLVFLANPNNPTGAYLGRVGLERLVRELPPGIILALDEAYREYVTAPDFVDGLALRGLRDRLVVMRTFSKIYGLAGLRCGYGVMTPELAGFLDRMRMPFNVTTVAQAGALAALGDEEHVARSREVNRAGMVQLGEGLGRLGLGVLPSQGNFVLVDLGAGREANVVFQKMLRKGVIVRSMAAYKLPTHIRITVGARAENERLLGALAECLG